LSASSDGANLGTKLISELTLFAISAVSSFASASTSFAYIIVLWWKPQIHTMAKNTEGQRSAVNS
jgi:hypothetical protein